MNEYTMIQLKKHQIKELAAIDTPTISNAIERLNVRCPTEGFMGREIKSLYPELGVMVGYAVTATIDSTTPSMRKEKRMKEFFQAIKESYKPVVLVLKTEGPKLSHTCVFGEIIAMAVKKLKAVGVVTDGCIRDLKQIRKLGFNVFAAGTVASHGIPSLTNVNASVKVGGIKVKSGDLIHGDENGILNIPWECIGNVIEEAKKVLVEEKSIIKSLHKYGLSSEVMKFFCG